MEGADRASFRGGEIKPDDGQSHPSPFGPASQSRSYLSPTKRSPVSALQKRKPDQGLGWKSKRGLLYYYYHHLKTRARERKNNPNAQCADSLLPHKKKTTTKKSYCPRNRKNKKARRQGGKEEEKENEAPTDRPMSAGRLSHETIPPYHHQDRERKEPLILRSSFPSCCSAEREREREAASAEGGAPFTPLCLQSVRSSVSVLGRRSKEEEDHYGR